MATTHLEKLLDDDRITAIGMIVEAHAALTLQLGRELETATGLPANWYGVLVRLGRSPEGRLRMSDLATAVALTTSGTTRLVDRIEAAGLIQRQPCPDDRRVAWAVLTPAGRDALARTTPVHLDGVQRHLVDPLSASELRALVAALRKVRDANWHGATRRWEP